MTVQEMKAKRAQISKRIHELHAKNADPKHDWTGTDEENWKASNKDYNDLTAKIEDREAKDADLKRVVETETAAPDPASLRSDVSHDPNVPTNGNRTSQPQITEEHRALALQAWCRCGAEDMELDAEHVDACKRLGFKPQRAKIELDLFKTREQRKAAHEFRALSAQLGATGAFTIAEGFIPTLEKALLAYGGVRQVATVFRTATGATLPHPTMNDTGNTGAQIEESEEDSTTDPTIGAVVFQAYKFTSRMIYVPTELLQDSAFDLASELASALGERLGRITNTRFTTGTGAATCYGIVEASTLGKTTASATAIGWYELDDLIHAVDPAYRLLGCGWMFHDNIVLYLRKLYDADGRPMWLPDANGNPPTTLKGYPYTVNQDMASTVASTNKTMLFGRLSKYYVRDVQAVRLRRLDERRAEFDQVVFVALMRCDGRLIDAGTNPVQHMLQA